MEDDEFCEACGGDGICVEWRVPVGRLLCTLCYLEALDLERADNAKNLRKHQQQETT